MNIEKTQKKEYVTPEMEELELVHRANLLECSGDDDGIECAEGIQFQ